MCPLVEEWVIVPAGYAHEGVGYCARWLCAWRSGLLCPLAMLMKEWVTVPAGYAHKGVGYCARSWRSGLLCPLVEEWVIVPARGGVGYCAPWLCS